MLTVVGEKAFQTMDLQMLVAMNRLMPELRPYPFWRFAKEDNDKGIDNELNDEEETEIGTGVLGLTRQSSQDIDRRLAER